MKKLLVILLLFFVVGCDNKMKAIENCTDNKYFNLTTAKEDSRKYIISEYKKHSFEKKVGGSGGFTDDYYLMAKICEKNHAAAPETFRLKWLK